MGPSRDRERRSQVGHAVRDDPSRFFGLATSRDGYRFERVSDQPVLSPMVTSPIYLVIQHWPEMWASLGVHAVTSLVLKFTWYDRLGPGEMYLTDDHRAEELEPVVAVSSKAAAAEPA